MASGFEAVAEDLSHRRRHRCRADAVQGAASDEEQCSPLVLGERQHRACQRRADLYTVDIGGNRIGRFTPAQVGVVFANGFD